MPESVDQAAPHRCGDRWKDDEGRCLKCGCDWMSERLAQYERDFDSRRARLAAATELLREMRSMLEQLPTGIDTEADESDTSPEDMVAHIGGLMWKRLAAFLEGCR